MVESVPGILSRIVEHKRAELAERLRLRAQWERLAADSGRDRRDFRAALTANPPAVIAEVKKASPSHGVFVENFDPAAIASTYAEGGAAALSVLTDERFFQGCLPDLETARTAAPGLPVLRKDFTIDEYHVIEAAAHGADAILLIAAILTADEMRRFRELAAQYRLSVLVEVHNQPELDRALESGAEILGVNNRDLHTFTVSLDTSVELAARIPENVIKVSESGIHSGADVRRLREAGFDAFLVGEHLMKSGDAAAAIRELRS